jgi:succinoglycan biosynthesis protein ExoM
MTSPTYSLIIPTMRRPQAIRAALRSVFEQDIAVDLVNQCEIIVVDNCPDHSAQAVLTVQAGESPFVLRIVHAPEPGVASARNTGWAAAKGSVIIFLDDDQEAHPGWLEALIRTHQGGIAPILFGPITARIPATSGRLSAYYAQRFARTGPSMDARLDDYFGCGNCLIDRKALGLSKPPFCVAANQIGGEDDLLFHRLQLEGTRFGWSAMARVDEVVPPSRATVRYTLRRAFAYGQGPSQSAASQRPANWLAVTGWMAVGFAQALVFGPMALMALPISRLTAMQLADRAAQGVGKVLWLPVFEPKFYGMAALRTSNRPD